MQTALKFLFSSDINTLQVIIAALIGSLIGEIRKEIVENDDGTPPKFSLFISEALVAAFTGSVVGLVLNELSLFDTNKNFILIIVSICGYAGYKKTMSIASIVLRIYANSKDTNTQNGIEEILTDLKNEPKTNSDVSTSNPSEEKDH